MIQIDLPMPESCDVCPLNYDFCWCKGFDTHEEWEKYSDDWNEQVCEAEHRPEYCPLKEQPDIVRCKDCVYGMVFKNVHGEQKIDCMSPNHNGTYVEAHYPSWFCADGERR